MRRLSILMYHGLVRDAAQMQAVDPEDRPYTLTLEQFERQLDALREAGLEVRDPAELEHGTIPGPGVLISFDDGHASNARLALPALLARDMRACFFVTTGFVGVRPGYCTWDQVRELRDAGMRVGAHGHSHRFLAALDDAQIAEELATSRQLLQRELGSAPRQMSFPGGRYDARAVRLAHAAGFTCLHGSRPGAVRPGGALPQVLPRTAVRPGMQPPAFMAFARADAGPMVRARTLEAAKILARGVLGHERYHRLYTRLRA